MGNMVDTYQKPKGVSDERWEGALCHYPDTTKLIYDIATAPGFTYEGRTKYDAINEQIKIRVGMAQYRETFIIWRDELLSGNTAVTIPIVTRNIVVCRT
jgi:hypothetical protein